eukprot:8952581-Lingulodinium_polyedra.AAC.1
MERTFVSHFALRSFPPRRVAFVSKSMLRFKVGVYTPVAYCVGTMVVAVARIYGGAIVMGLAVGRAGDVEPFAGRHH